MPRPGTDPRGVTLRQVLDSQGRLSEPHARHIFQQILVQLSGYHGADGAGDPHAQLCPENILVDDAGNVTLLEPSSRNANAAIHGIAYRSLEQRTLSDNIDSRTDLFSAAVIMCEMLTGKVPERPPTKETHSNLDPKYGRLICRCMAPVRYRLKTVADLQDALATEIPSGSRPLLDSTSTVVPTLASADSAIRPAPSRSRDIPPRSPHEQQSQHAQLAGKLPQSPDPSDNPIERYRKVAKDARVERNLTEEVRLRTSVRKATRPKRTRWPLVGAGTALIGVCAWLTGSHVLDRLVPPPAVATASAPADPQAIVVSDEPFQTELPDAPAPARTATEPGATRSAALPNPLQQPVKPAATLPDKPSQPPDTQPQTTSDTPPDGNSASDPVSATPSSPAVNPQPVGDNAVVYGPPLPANWVPGANRGNLSIVPPALRWMQKHKQVSANDIENPHEMVHALRQALLAADALAVWEDFLTGRARKNLADAARVLAAQGRTDPKLAAQLGPLLKVNGQSSDQTAFLTLTRWWLTQPETTRAIKLARVTLEEETTDRYVVRVVYGRGRQIQLTLLLVDQLWKVDF